MANSTSVTKCTDFSVSSLCRDMKTSPPDPAIVVGGTGTNMKLTLPLAACAPFSSNMNGPTAITTAVAGRPPPSTSPSPATLRELYAMAASQQHQQHSRLLELSNRYRGYPEIAHHVFNQQGAVTKLLERIRGTITTTESSLSELSGSSVCSESNRGVSRKATSFDVSTCNGDDPISVDTPNEIDRYAEESTVARTNTQRSIDDVVKSEKQSKNASLNEMSGKMYIIDKFLNCKDHSKTKCSIDDQRRSTDVMVETDLRFDRYDAEDSQIFSGDRDDDVGSFSSSWVLSTDDTISGGRYLFPGKPAGMVAVKVKGRKRYGRKKTVAWRQARSARPKSGRDSEDRNSSKELPLSPQLMIGFGEDCGKYFANSSAAPSRRKREQQIKDAYAAAAGENTRAPVAMARRTTDRNHEASSFINRKMRSREITRINKIIADKILNVQTTIPKTKK